MFETFKIQGKKVLRDSPSIYEMNQSQQNKITVEQYKSKKEKLKSPHQLSHLKTLYHHHHHHCKLQHLRRRNSYISQRSLKHTIQDKEIQDSPSMHEMKQMQHLNMVPTKQQKSSQMVTPSKKKQKSTPSKSVIQKAYITNITNSYSISL